MSYPTRDAQPRLPSQPPNWQSNAPDAHSTVLIGILRAIDANGNRAREAVRVVEDYVRFVLDDRHLTERCKTLRHAIAQALARIPQLDRLAARETQADVGTQLSVPTEISRPCDADLVGANFGRLQEALRSLEEFGKRISPPAAAELEQLRYQAYTLERAVAITGQSQRALAQARLYVLLDGQATAEEFCRLARTLVQAGVHIVQLRDKRLDDRPLLERARLLRAITREGNTLLVMNDRPDLAVLADADGVHVGQEEVTVKDARTIVGPHRLVGVSTHSIEQARQAVLDGANYLGVGPTFPSGTKQFDHFPGLELVHAVAEEIRLPAFAIGGITAENLPQVLAAGLARVAVSGAITTADSPEEAVCTLLAMLGKV
jgi:thiamine-phosphate pyrophosphorylase